MKILLVLFGLICLSSATACATIQSITSGGNPQPPTATPVLVPDNYQIGEIHITQTTIDRVVSVVPITLPNCQGSSNLTVRHTFTHEVDRTPELIGFDAARLNISVQTAVAAVNAGLQVDPADNSRLTESYELEMSAAPGTSVEYHVQWMLTSKTGVIEFLGARDTVFVEFTAPQMLRAVPQEPKRNPCSEATRET